MIYLEPREDLDNAIIATQNGRVIYDYESLVRCYAEHFVKNSKERIELDKAIEEAIDFVSYNTIGSLSYFGEGGPLVVSAVRDGERLDEIEEESLETIMLNGLLWEVLS
jgi:hypothetical protein